MLLARPNVGIQRLNSGIIVPGGGAGGGGGSPGDAATDFDGSTYYGRGANLTGAADGKQGTLCGWIKFNEDANAHSLLLSLMTGTGSNTTDEGMRMFRQGASLGKIGFNIRNSLGTALFNFTTSNDYNSSNGWFWFGVCWDLATASSCHARSVSNTGTITTEVSGATGTDDNVDYTKGNAFISARNADFLHDGCQAEIWFAGEYLDLSVDANVRKFVDASGNPVDLGEDGSTPTGNQPLVYFPGDDMTTNLGTGGDFSLTAGTAQACADAPGGGAGGGGGYTTGAKAGNGSTYFSYGAAPTGVSDNALWTVSVWLKPNSDTNDRQIMELAGSGDIQQPMIYIREAFGKWQLELNTTLVQTRCPSSSGGSPGFDGAWHHVLMWQNGTAQSQGGYLDGSANVTSDPVNSGTIDFTGTDMFWLANNALGEILDNGWCISDLWVDIGQIVDDPAEFRDSVTGKPLDLGSDGSNPGAGTQPTFFFKGGDFTTNLGSAETPTRTGSALSDCASSPTD